jgi:hypothetical protein
MMDLNLFELHIIANALEGQINGLSARLKDRAWDDAPVSKARMRRDLWDVEQLRERILDEISPNNKVPDGDA